MELTEAEYIEQLDELEMLRIPSNNRKNRYWVPDEILNKAWQYVRDSRYPFLHITSNFYMSESSDKEDWVDIVRVHTYNTRDSAGEVDICVCGNPETKRIGSGRGGPKTYVDALRAVAAAKARVSIAYEQMQQEKV